MIPMHVRGNGVSDKKMMPILGICMWGDDRISVLDWLLLGFALQERMSIFILPSGL